MDLSSEKIIQMECNGHRYWLSTEEWIRFQNFHNKNMSDFKTRLVQERTELSDKTGKLDSFLNSEAFHTIDEKQQELLKIQVHLMKSYEWVLNQRINLL
jgi:hypothetical protein